MSRATATIIAVIKSVNAAPGSVARPFTTLIKQVATEHDIHLQVEDIEGGLLVFWQDREDFDRTARVLIETATGLGDGAWAKCDRLWRVTLLKPPMQAGGDSILGTCKDMLQALIGPRSAPEVRREALLFRAPVGVNLLMAFWRQYQNL